MKKIITSLLIITTFTVTSCAVNEPAPRVKAMQRKDKNLSCREILLEMNEAEFYQQMARKSKGPKLQNFLMPLGYISTYMDAEDAYQAANARVRYLEKVYDIMNCGQRSNYEDNSRQLAPVQEAAPPIQSRQNQYPTRKNKY